VTRYDPLKTGLEMFLVSLNEGTNASGRSWVDIDDESENSCPRNRNVRDYGEMGWKMGLKVNAVGEGAK